MAGPKEYNVRVAGGRMIPVTASSDDEARKMVRDILMKESAAEKGAAGGIDNFGRSLARGASFGLADEFSAAADATVGPAVDWALGKVGLGSTNTSAAPEWSKRYEENLARERGQDKAYDSAYPVWSTTGKVGGALATLPMLPAFLAPSGGGAMLPAAAKMAGAGAVIGGATGFGEGEGGFLPRLGDAATDAAVGGVIGGATVPVGRAVSNVAGTVGNAVAESGFGRRVADKYVGPGMRAVADKLDDLSPRLPPMMGGKQVPKVSLSAAAPDDGAMVPAQNWLDDAATYIRNAAPTSGNILDDAAARRIAAAVSRGGDDVPGMGRKMTDTGTDWMPLDTNPMTQRLGMVVHSSPGPGPGVINTALDARNRGTPGRMLGALGDEANVPSIYDAERYLTANQRNVGATAYGAMDEAGLRQSPELMKLYENPIVSDAIDRIMRAEQQTRLGTNRAPASPVEIMHKVKQAIWDMGFDGPNARPGPNASWYRDLGVQYVDALKRANPALAEADRAYAQAASLPEWMKRGQNFMRSGTSDAATEVSPSALAAEIPTATPAQNLALKVGSTNTIKDTLAQGPDSARRLAKAVDTNELLRQKLTEIYGPDVAERMMKQSAIERNLFAKTDNVVRGNSNTAMKIGAMLDDAATADLPTTSQGLVSRLLSSVGEAYQKARAGNESVRERVAQMLTETDPVLNAELMAKIERQLQMAKRARPAQRTVAVGATRATE